MSIDTVAMAQVKTEWGNYKYALIYMISELIFQETKEIGQINWDECQEAYFFDTAGQMHVFQSEEGTLNASRFTEASEANRVEHRYQLAKTSKVLKVYEYLEQDEDGQTVVTYTRLVSIDERG